MGSVNKAILVGNLGGDAEVTTTSGGFPIARFSLATTHRRKDNRSGDWEDRTEWHRIVLLGKQAESLREYLKKGKQVYVEGRIETRSWDDKDGQKRYMTEIIADRIQLLGGAGGGRSASTTRDDYPDATIADVAADSDDIPFCRRPIDSALPEPAFDELAERVDRGASTRTSALAEIPGSRLSL